MHVQSKLSGLTDWQPETIQQAIDDTVSELSIGMGKVGMPLRVAVTGAGQSPNLDTTLHLIGQQRTLERIAKAIEFIEQREAQQ